MTPLLSVEHLTKHFPTRHGVVRAVDDVSFTVVPGETLALVGESGCGKTTVALSLLRLLRPDSGRVSFEGVDLEGGTDKAEKAWRQRLSIVFQNPYSSLDPRMKIRNIVGEPLITAYGLLDEPTAALDVSVQAQVLNLLQGLQKNLGLSYLFISHNLATVENIADRVLVMYLGRLVEEGPVDEVFAAPRHPYTRGLLDSVPSTDARLRGRLRAVSGEIPSALHPPPGCAFWPRCARAGEECRGTPPPLVEAGPRRSHACLHPLSPSVPGRLQ